MTYTGASYNGGENDGGGGGGGMKEFAGTMRHRESPGETVSLARLGQTRAPLYPGVSALAGADKGLPCF